jgi:predicted kinase
MATDYEHSFARYQALAPAADASPGTAILVAGVPGTGKSTLAEGLARALRAPVFSIDWQLGALTPFRVLTNENAGPIAEMMLIAAQARQLQLGLDAVLDTFGGAADDRRRYRAVAENLGGRFIGVECTCSDEVLHRARVEGRERGIPGWKPTVSWEHVLRMQARWEPWDEPHPVLDSAKQSPAEMLELTLEEVRASLRAR